MRTIKFISLLLFCLYAITAHAQTETDVAKSLVGINVGLQQSFIQDLHFSPLNYSGAGISVGLNYQRNLQKAIFLSRFDFGSSYVEGAITDETETLNQLGNIELSYLRAFRNKNESLRMYLGPGLKSRIDVLDFDDYEAVTFFNFHSLELAYLVSYEVSEKHQLDVLASLPLFGVLTRPPHSGWDFEVYNRSGLYLIYNGDLVTANSAFGFTLRGKYQYNFSSKMNFVFQSSLQSMHTKEVNTAKYYHLQNTAGINLKF